MQNAECFMPNRGKERKKFFTIAMCGLLSGSKVS